MAQLPFVPGDFDPPTTLETDHFRLEPLAPQHNEAAHHAAWTSSIAHIRSTPGYPDGNWPPLEGMSPDRNREDLRRHAADFDARIGFTFTVLDPATGDVIGCVYIYPPESADADVTVQPRRAPQPCGARRSACRRRRRLAGRCMAVGARAPPRPLSTAQLARIDDRPARALSLVVGIDAASAQTPHDGAAGVGATDFGEPLAEKCSHRSGEQGGAADLVCLEGVGVDRVALDGGSSMHSPRGSRIASPVWSASVSSIPLHRTRVGSEPR